MSCDGLLWPIAALPFAYLPPKIRIYTGGNTRDAPRVDETSDACPGSTLARPIESLSLLGLAT
jgi:hypothetical protein